MLRHVCDAKKSRLRHDLPIYVKEIDFTISPGFYFHETSHMRSFAILNRRENFRIYRIQIIDNMQVIVQCMLIFGEK